MSEYDDINKSLEDRLHHLCESEFIASFDQIDPKTHEYIRDISEADKLVYVLERSQKARAELNDALIAISNHLLGEKWYSIGVDPVNVREEMVKTICERYPAVDESPGDKWRRRHKRCKFCTHCRVTPPIDIPCVNSFFECDVKECKVNLNTPRPFCYMFELRKDK